MESVRVLEKYYGWLKAIITSNECHEEMLNEQLSSINLEERLTFLRYLLKEHQQGIIEILLKQRFENEVYFEEKFFTSEELVSFSPAERAYFHLCRVHGSIEILFTTTIPVLFKEFSNVAEQINKFSTHSGSIAIVLTESPAPLNNGKIPEVEESVYDGKGDLLTTEQAAKLLGVSKATIYRHVSVTKMLVPITTGKMSSFRKEDVLKLYKVKTYRNPELEIELEKQYKSLKKKRELQ